MHFEFQMNLSRNEQNSDHKTLKNVALQVHVQSTIMFFNFL